MLTRGSAAASEGPPVHAGSLFISPVGDAAREAFGGSKTYELKGYWLILNGKANRADP
jgi:hypothetical protein